MKKIYLIFITLLFTSTAYAKPSKLDEHIKDLNEKGVTVLSQVYSYDEIQAFRDGLKPIVNKVEDVLKTPGKTRIFHNDGRVTKTAYWKLGNRVVLKAGPGRFDTRYGLEDGVFANEKFQHNPKIDQLVKKMLHNRYVHHTGVVYSAPGSSDQYWHRDTDNISDTDSDGSKLVQMDDFYYTVLIPLVPMNKKNGTTEFRLGTHRKTAGSFDKAETVQYDLDAGDVLVFNGKISHRGRANNSSTERPVLYVVYYKGWYNDTYREGVE